jgi:hypothetical protein
MKEPRLFARSYLRLLAHLFSILICIKKLIRKQIIILESFRYKLLPRMSTSMVAGPVLLESTVKFVGTPGCTFPFSRPGPKAFTFEASAGPVPFPPE